MIAHHGPNFYRHNPLPWQTRGTRRSAPLSSLEGRRWAHTRAEFGCPHAASTTPIGRPAPSCFAHWFAIPLNHSFPCHEKNPQRTRQVTYHKMQLRPCLPPLLPLVSGQQCKQLLLKNDVRARAYNRRRGVLSQFSPLWVHVFPPTVY